MISIRSFLILFALLTSTLHYSQYTDDINSNRPGESMGGFSVGKSIFQAELGVYGINDQHKLLNEQVDGFDTKLSLRYGALLDKLELNLDLLYQNDQYQSNLKNETRSGFKQTTLGVKYLIYDPNKNYKKKPNVFSWKANHTPDYRKLIPAVGIYAGMNINTKSIYAFPNEPEITPKVILITQNQFEREVLTINIIADKIATNAPSYSYIITLTRGFSPRWIGFIENQGIKGYYYSDAILRGGAAFLISQNIQIDASMGTNFKNTPSKLFGGIGLSWRIENNDEKQKF